MPPTSDHRRPLTGAALKALRGSRSFREIAEIAGISHSTISEAEHGRISACATLGALAEVYGVTFVIDGRERYWIVDR